MIYSILICSSLMAVVLSQEGGFMGLPSLNGNVGLKGDGYGDVYGGQIKEGVYGAGGRIGGNLGLTGTGGLGRKKREVAMNAAGSDATSLTGAGSEDKFSVAGSSAGQSELSIAGFPGRKKREVGMNAAGANATSLTGAGSGGHFSVGGSSAGQSELSIAGFPGRKRREAEVNATEVETASLNAEGSVN